MLPALMLIFKSPNNPRSMPGSINTGPRIQYQYVLDAARNHVRSCCPVQGVTVLNIPSTGTISPGTPPTDSPQLIGPF